MKPATGSKPTLGKDGIWRFRLTLHGHRSVVALPTASNLRDATERRNTICELAKRMAGVDRRKALDALRDVAVAPSEVDLAGACKWAEKLIGGWTAPRTSAAPTLRVFSEWWNIGRVLPDGTRLLLQDEKPDVCRAGKKKGRRSENTRKAQARNLETYALKLAGDVPVDMIDLTLSNKVRDSVPAHLRSNVRRQYLTPFKVALDICVRLGYMDRSPLPAQWLPPDEGSRDLQWIYPREDLKVMRNRDVPLCWRAFLGFMPRNGGRETETCLMTLGHFDLDVGGARLEKRMTKTKQARRWRLAPSTETPNRTRGTDCWVALLAWVAMARADAAPTDRMFITDRGTSINPKTIKLPELARKYLRMSGVTRAELFITDADSMQFNVHNYRASFVTVKVNQGWNDREIGDCTGHESDAEITRYRREAKTFADLDRGDFTPLHEAIPEIAEYLAAHPECAAAAGWQGHTDAFLAANPRCAELAGWTRHSHPIATQIANTMESLALPHSMVESVLGLQPSDMPKLPQNSPPSIPSSPVPLGADGQSMAQLQGRLAALEAVVGSLERIIVAQSTQSAQATAEVMARTVIRELASAGVVPRPRPVLVVSTDADADSDDPTP